MSIEDRFGSGAIGAHGMAARMALQGPASLQVR